MTSFIDLSHPIEHGLITYRGSPAPLICDYLSREQSKELYEPGTTFQNPGLSIQLCWVLKC